MRWSAADLEQAIVEDLARLRLPDPELAAWFRTALSAALGDVTAYQRRQGTALAKRQSELATMQDRLLNAYLAGTVDADIFHAKSAELKTEARKVEENREQLGEVDPLRTEAALAIFDWTQNAAETWVGSNNATRREILDLVCLNRTLSDVNLVTEKRKPFDVFAERLEMQNSRGDWSFTEQKIIFTAEDLRVA